MFEHEDVEDTAFGSRNRFLAWLRAGFYYHWSEQAWVHFRARTGQENDITSADWTVADDQSPFEFDALFFPDIYAFHYQNSTGNQLYSLGRMPFPFFENSEFLADNDATFLGGYAKWQWPCAFEPESETYNQFRAGLFFQPDGAFRLHSYLAAAQLVREQQTGIGKFLLGTGVYHWAGEDGAKHLDPVTSSHDFTVLGASLQFTPAGEPLAPWSVGVDVLHGLQTPPIPHSGDRTGFTALAKLGENEKAGDWQLRYQYLYIPAGAALDDFGASSYSRLGSSNIRGHDMRVTYSVLDDLTLTARAALIDQIHGNGATNRFRFYFVYTF